MLHDGVRFLLKSKENWFHFELERFIPETTYYYVDSNLAEVYHSDSKVRDGLSRFFLYLPSMCFQLMFQNCNSCEESWPQVEITDQEK